MLRLYIPAAVSVALILSLTFWESTKSNRWGQSSVTAEEFTELFSNLPMNIGPWVGIDKPVSEETLETAGAVNYVSRQYVHQETSERVDLWLIVGHARDICRHTPDVCYPSQGFSQDGNKLKQQIRPEGEEPATFYTARFRMESSPLSSQRVFWAWNANEKDDRQWVAPDNQRLRFGNNSKLYKMYFTASMADKDQPITENTAYRFGKMILPVINRALFPKQYEETASEAAVEAVEAATAENVDDQAAGLPDALAAPVDKLEAPATELTSPTEDVELEPTTPVLP